MKGTRVQLAFAVAALLAAGPARAQVGIGGHLARATDAFGETRGLGVRLQLGVPLVPVSLAVNGEYFFPHCPSGDCALYGTTFDLNWVLPLPFLQPWLGAGWSVRELEVAGRHSTERGPNVGVGVQLQLFAVRPFVDVRYEFAGAPEKQTMVRIGLMLR
jgi:hypothetical protein